jgi:hypothetical protein
MNELLQRGVSNMAKSKRVTSKATVAKKTKKVAAKAAVPAATKKDVVSILQPNLQHAVVSLVGISPVLVHAWDKKNIRMIEDKQQGKAKGPRKKRDPEAEYQACFYKDENGDYGLPATAFKGAITDCATFSEGVTKVKVRGAIVVEGDILPFKEFSKPKRRTDMVRIGMGTADVRYRPEFSTWAIDIPVQYNADVISTDELFNLFELAGFHIGVGEWRPQKNGSMGRFTVKRS